MLDKEFWKKEAVKKLVVGTRMKYLGTSVMKNIERITLNSLKGTFGMNEEEAKAAYDAVWNNN